MQKTDILWMAAQNRMSLCDCIMAYLERMGENKCGGETGNRSSRILHSASEQMTSIRGSYCRDQGDFDDGECVRPAAAILVNEFPVKSCQGHPGTLV